TADSAITDESVDFLSQRLRGGRKSFVLCARLLHSGKTSAGYRDEMEKRLQLHPALVLVHADLGSLSARGGSGNQRTPSSCALPDNESAILSAVCDGLGAVVPHRRERLLARTDGQSLGEGLARRIRQARSHRERPLAVPWQI